jgi:hypothetical protein
MRSKIRVAHTNQLSHPSFDTIKTAKDLHRALDASRFPAGNGFQFRQRLVKTLAGIGQELMGEVTV